MNIAEFSIRNRTTTLVLTIVLLIGGLWAYLTMGRLEDPEFTIKEALVVTAYPGASPREVADEVTDKLESAIQQLGQLKKIEAVSTPGLSIISVEVKEKYGKELLPQVWDELRRKVNDAAHTLPPGAVSPTVYDDFGDVYGLFYAVTGDGYSYEELKDYVDYLRKELLLVQDVAKVTIWGAQTEAIFVEMSRARMRSLGVSVDAVYNALQQRNLVVESGHLKVGPEYLRISPTGDITSVEDLGNLYIRAADSSELVYLRDIATITRGYQEPSTNIMRHGGMPSLAIAVSLASGGNVVDLGERVTKRLAELDANTPVGLNIEKIYYQPDYVNNAVDGFAVSLSQAIAIVVIVLMLTMGLQSGLIIGGVLLITVCGSFIFMKSMDIQLQRISLGALIIALGMLVDNAIVVTEGMLVRIKQGANRLKAASEVVQQNLWPLLGATVIAVVAFSAIGLSDDNTGEYCGSLFWVLLISLMLSWVTAITITPLFCEMFIKPKADTTADPYGGFVFRSYKKLLRGCLNYRWITLASMLVMLVASIAGFGYVKQSFFPNSTQPQFFIDYWKPEGTDIRETSAEMKLLEDWIAQDERVDFASTFVGAGAPRFMLVYSQEKQYPNFGQIIVTVKDYREIPAIIADYRAYCSEYFPETFFKFKKVRLGPGRDDPIEVRFNGPDPEVLRELALQAQAIMRSHSNVQGIRDNWRQKVKVVSPVVAEAAARRAGIDRTQIADALQTAYTGKSIGVYREGDTLLPIISRLPEREREDIAGITSVQVWSPVAGAMLPLNQVVSGTGIRMADNVVHTRDRKFTITVACEQKEGLAAPVFAELRPLIEAMPLPAGYSLEWGGEFEDSRDAQAALAASIPIAIAFMVLITIMLFNALRQPLIIWLTVPLSVIGITVGLLATGQPFGFMALLGALSLTGMLIKNAIVLLDEIGLQIRSGKEPFTAVLDSSISRMRPVLMAAGTTVLGLIPLLGDAFFISMAVTIMAGLTFASILTLIIVPVLYVILFGVHEAKSGETADV